MPKLEIPFATQEGRSSVEQNSRETLTNMFSEIEVSGRRKLVRRQRMGLEAVYALTGEKRCIEKNGSLHYLVVGAKAYSFTGTTLTEIGTLDTSTGRCTMVFDDNGEVLISDGAKAYHWSGSVFSEPTTDGAVDTLTFLAGYAVYNEPNTGRFWWSGINDMEAWDGLDFATAEGKPDVLKRVYEDHRQLWLLGGETTEVWTLSGGTDSPFSFYTALERGVRAPLSVVSEDNSLCWLGDDDIVYRADGYRPVRISTHSIERLIQDLTEDERASGEAFSYSDQGHKFYTIRFPGKLTLQYNFATRFWNVAKTFGSDDWDILGPQFTKTDYVLTTAGISRLKRGINTDEGEIMERGGVSAPISEGASRVLIRSFFLDCEVGRAGAGVEPQVMLRVARDGETFGNERWRSLGTTGQFGRRAMWRNLGIGRRMCVEVNFTDDAEFSIIGADIEGEILDG